MGDGEPTGLRSPHCGLREDPLGALSRQPERILAAVLFGREHAAQDVPRSWRPARRVQFSVDGRLWPPLNVSWSRQQNLGLLPVVSNVTAGYVKHAGFREPCTLDPGRDYREQG